MRRPAEAGSSAATWIPPEPVPAEAAGSQHFLEFCCSCSWIWAVALVHQAEPAFPAAEPCFGSVALLQLLLLLLVVLWVVMLQLLLLLLVVPPGLPPLASLLRFRSHHRSPRHSFVAPCMPRHRAVVSLQLLLLLLVVLWVAPCMLAGSRGGRATPSRCEPRAASGNASGTIAKRELNKKFTGPKQQTHMPPKEHNGGSV